MDLPLLLLPFLRAVGAGAQKGNRVNRLQSGKELQRRRRCAVEDTERDSMNHVPINTRSGLTLIPLQLRKAIPDYRLSRACRGT